MSFRLSVPAGDGVLSPRLILTPLSRKAFALFLRDRNAFARARKLVAPPMAPTDEIQKALEWLYGVSEAYDDHARVWGTLWTIVLREENRLVGTLCFKGAPCEREAELAYYIEKPFQNRGYMTEALCTIVKWAEDRDDVDSLTAETLITNAASQKALRNAGFQQAYDAPFPLVDSCFWRRALNVPPS